MTTLTSEEHAHIENGGRVFLIEEILGPLWRILSVSKEGISILCKPEPQEGYSDLKWAEDLARGIAALSEDDPIVRVCIKS